MKKILAAIVFSTVILTVNAFAQTQTYLQKIAGDWEGTLEYQDYSKDKRVTLKTYLTVVTASDGNSAEFVFTYDDFGKIIKSKETVKIDLTAKKYFAGKTEYKIDRAESSKIVLRGEGQDGEKVEPIRKTIVFSADSLNILKETRTPWQFRNQMIFQRAKKNVLPPKASQNVQKDAVYDVTVKSKSGEAALILNKGLALK